VASWGHKVSKTTIRGFLHANRLFVRHGRKKPFLTNTHKRKHLEFAKGNWDFNWDRVLWSEDTKIELFGNKHSKWVWRKTKDYKRLCRKAPHAHVKWWRICDALGLFLFQRPGKLVRVHCFVNSLKYQNILSKNLIASAKKLKMFFFIGSFSRIMIQNVWQIYTKKCSAVTNSRSSHGHLSPQTSTQSKTCGVS